MVRTNQKKLLEDIKILPSEDYITKHKPLVCDFKIKKVKHTWRKFWTHEKRGNYMKTSVKSDLQSKQYGASSQKIASVESYWKVLKGALLEASGRTCGWTKDRDRH